MDRFGRYIESVRCFCQAGVVDKNVDIFDNCDYVK